MLADALREVSTKIVGCIRTVAIPHRKVPHTYIHNCIPNMLVNYCNIYPLLSAYFAVDSLREEWAQMRTSFAK